MRKSVRLRRKLVPSLKPSPKYQATGRKNPPNKCAASLRASAMRKSILAD